MKGVLRVCCLIFFCVTSFISLAQHSIDGIVKDIINKQTLPFASIGIKDSTHGTISNINGEFSLTVSTYPCEIIIRYVGYRTKVIKIDLPTSNIVFYLSPKTAFLPEVTVHSNSNKKLAKLLTKIRSKNKKSIKTINSKSFMRYSTSQDDTIPKELMEGYFNCKSNVSGIKSLKLKSGKVIIPEDDHYFLSLDIIRKFILDINLFKDKDSKYAQLTPLYINDNKHIANLFSLSTYSLSDSNAIIAYQSDKLNCKGELIYDNISFQLKKIKISKTYYDSIPIESINKDQKIDSLKLNLEINFKKLKKAIYVDYYSGNLKFNYTSLKSGATQMMKSDFFIKQYDINTSFFLPAYNVDLNELNDYEEILITPYNQNFWDREFTFKKTKQELSFLKKIRNKNYYQNKAPFLRWRIDRIYGIQSFDWKKIDSLGTNNNDKKINLSEYKKYGANYNQFDNEQNYYNIETGFVYNYSIYGDTSLFDVIPFIDYNNSYFSLPRTEYGKIVVQCFCAQTIINADLLLKELKKNNSKSNDLIDRTIRKYFMKERKDRMNLMDKIKVKTDKNGKWKIIIANDDLKYIKQLISKSKDIKF